MQLTLSNKGLIFLTKKKFKKPGMFLPENSHFLPFLNDHRVLTKLELCDRLKSSKKFEFSGKNCLPALKNKKRKIGGQRGCSHPLDQLTRLKLNDGK